MITLSKEIQQAVQAAKENPVRLIDPETKAEYIVLPAETFEQLQNRVYYDAGPITPEERQELLIQAGLRAGWDDPEMDVYNDLDPRGEDESSTR